MALSRYAKAFTSAITAAAVPLGGAVTATSDQGSTITQGEWVTAVVAALVAGFAVAAVPNSKPKGDPPHVGPDRLAVTEPQAGQAHVKPVPPEGGYGLVELVIAVLVIVLLVLLILRYA